MDLLQEMTSHLDATAGPEVGRVLIRALSEDLGDGDITSELTVAPDARAAAVILTRERAVVAGLDLVRACFEALEQVGWTQEVEDGDTAPVDAVIARLEGPARSILAVERTALNLLSRLSGIATLTRLFVDAVAGTRVRILDTRKTTPGLRVLEKYAVRVGGGHNHRFCLDDGILIKDNHVALAGGAAEAVRRAKEGRPTGLLITVEVAELAGLSDVIDEEPDRILLDNMAVDDVRAAVDLVDGRITLEVSGGVDLDNVRSYAETGVDEISIGRLTHSASAIDLSLELVPS